MSKLILKTYVQYGAGNKAIPGWINFDASPTLRIQKIPIIGRLIRSRLNCIFDDNVLYGDIVKGLPIKSESIDGLFCSHVLEHLTYSDFSLALKNSFSYLKLGGRFRIIVPDLEYYVKRYQLKLASDNLDEKASAAVDFCKETGFGIEDSRLSLTLRIKDFFRNSGHRWMWDNMSLTQALKAHGFVNIKRFQRGDCVDEMFLRPEQQHQFGDSKGNYGLAIECNKPN